MSRDRERSSRRRKITTISVSVCVLEVSNYREEFLGYQEEGARQAVDSHTGHKLSTSDLKRLQAAQHSSDQAVFQVYTERSHDHHMMSCDHPGSAGKHQTVQQDRENGVPHQTKGDGQNEAAPVNFWLITGGVG